MTLPAVAERRPDEELVDLCQYTFVLRLLSLVLIVYTLGVPDDPLVYVLTATSYLLAIFAALCWRRLHRTVAAHPLLVGVDAVLALAAVAAAGPGSGYWLLSLGPALLVGLVYPPAAATLLGALLSVGYLAASELALASTGEPLSLSRTLLYPVLVFVAGLVRNRVLRLAAAHERLSQRAAALDERARLAREMHDTVVKTLHGISLATHALADAPPQDRAALQQRLRLVSRAAQTGAEEARSLLVTLRADEPDRPFIVVLEDVVSAWSEAHALPATVRSSGLADLDDAVRYELLAAVREALDNAAAHARATCLQVLVEADRDHVVVEVVDDGVGFDPERAGARARRTGHFGLVGIEERLQRVGGTARFLSRAGTGTRVQLRAPRAVHQ